MPRYRICCFSSSDPGKDLVILIATWRKCETQLYVSSRLVNGPRIATIAGDMGPFCKPILAALLMSLALPTFLLIRLRQLGGDSGGGGRRRGGP